MNPDQKTRPSLSARKLDVRIEWALAAALQAMSSSALDGPTLRHIQSVVDHLRFIAHSQTAPEQLRHVCDKLSDLWWTIDLA